MCVLSLNSAVSKYCILIIIIQNSRTSSGSFQHWLPQYRIDIVLVSSPSIVTESGTVFQYRYRPAPQNPVPIHIVQGRFNTVFDPDSRIDFWVCKHVGSNKCKTTCINGVYGGKGSRRLLVRSDGRSCQSIDHKSTQ